MIGWGEKEAATIKNQEFGPLKMEDGQAECEIQGARIRWLFI